MKLEMIIFISLENTLKRDIWSKRDLKISLIKFFRNGVRFDVSPSLQSRIKALNHGLKHSIRTIDSLDFRDECV